MNMNPKTVLMIGGPADGQRFLLDARTRDFTYLETTTPEHKGKEFCYAVGILTGAFGAQHHIGVRDLNRCAILDLLTAYHRPYADESDEREAANEHIVTILGGPGDGMRTLAAPEDVQVTPPLRREADQPVPVYAVVPLVGKSQRAFRVAVLDEVTVDPIALLVEGYRKPMPEPCKFCGGLVEDPCETPPPDICEKALAARKVRT
jgi:hypothetical protein